MNRRPLILALTASLLAGGLLVAPPAAADPTPDPTPDVAQVLDLSGEPTTHRVGTPWEPEPIREGAPPLVLTADPDPAGACEVEQVGTPARDVVAFTYAGTCEVTAVAPGYTDATDDTVYTESDPVPLSLTIEGHETETTIESLTVAPLVGAPVELRATVDSGTHERPTGTVRFVELGDDDTSYADDTPLVPDQSLRAGATATTAIADTTVTPSDADPVEYAAIFLPASPTTLGGSRSVTPVEVVASRRTPVVSVSLVDADVAVGDQVEVEISANEKADGTGTDVRPALTGGTVSVDGVSTGTVDWADTGATTHRFTAPAAGSHTVEVSFVPANTDRYASPVSGSATLRVGKPTTTTLSVGEEPTVDEPLAVTATVDSGSNGYPAGRVDFYRQGTATRVGYVVVPAGTGTTVTVVGSVTPVDSDDHLYYARYEPADPAIHAASESDPQSTAIAKRRVDVDFTVTTTPVVRDRVEPLTVTVTATDARTETPVAPDEDDSFVTVDGAEVATEWNGHVGEATLPIDAVGTFQVGVTFVPELAARYGSPTVTEQPYVVVEPTETELDAVTPAPKLDETFTLTARVSADPDADLAGTVEFYERGDSEPLGDPVPLKADDTATWEVTAEDLDDHDYYAVFVPTDLTTHAGSTSDDVRVTARKRDVLVTIAPERNPTAVNAPVEVVITATDLDDSDVLLEPAGGSVEVTIGTGPAQTVPWEDGQATVTFSPGTRGDHQVSVDFVPHLSTRYLAPGLVSQPVTALYAQTPTGSVPTGPHYAGRQVRPTIDGAYGVVTLVPRTTATCTLAANGLDLLLVRDETCTVDFTTAGDPDHLPGEGFFSFTVTPRPVEVEVHVAPDKTPYGVDVLLSATATETDPLDADDTSILAGTGVITVTKVVGSIRTEVFEDDYEYAVGDELTLDLPEPATYEVSATFTPTDDLEGVLAADAVGTAPLDVSKIEQNLTFGTPTARQLHVGEVWPTPVTNSVTDPGHEPTLEVLTPSGQPEACEVTEDGTGIRFLRARECEIAASVDEGPHHQAGYKTTKVTAALRPVLLRMKVTTADEIDDVPRYHGPATVTITAVDGLAATAVPAGNVPIEGAGTIEIVGVDDPTADPGLLPFTGGSESRLITPEQLGRHDVLVGFTPDLSGGVERWVTVVADEDEPTDSFTVEEGRQRILWGPTDTAVHDGEAVVDVPRDTRATSSAGLTGIKLEVDAGSADVCSVSGLVVSFTKATGTDCVVKASHPGDTLWLPAERSQTIEVKPRKVDMVVSWPTGPHPYGTPVEVTVTVTDHLTGARVPDVGATGRSGDGNLRVGTIDHPLVFKQGSATATYDPAGVGSYTVSATFDADREHVYVVDPVPTVPPLVTTIASQTIRFTTPPPVDPNKSDTWVPGATGGTSGNAIEVTATPATVCEVVGTAISFTGLGECTVRFTQDGEPDLYEDGERQVVIDVVPLAVVLTLTTPASGTAYAVDTSLTVTAKTVRAPTATVAGTADVTILDTTDAPDYDPTTDPTDPTQVDGVEVELETELTLTDAAPLATLELPAERLLAGTYWVRVDHDPTSSEYAEATSYQRFVIDLATQRAALETPGSEPDPGYVSRTWTPDFADNPSGEDTLLQVDDAASVPTRPGDESVPATCSTSDDELSLVFDAQGPCTVTATVPGIERMYDESPALDLVVVVERIPVTLGLTVLPAPRTQPEASHTDGPVVDGVVTVRATTVDHFGRPVPGNGPLTVAGTVIDRPASWLGGGTVYSYVPKVAGPFTASGTFTPADQRTFVSDTESVGYRVWRAQQRIILANTPATPAVVRGSWTPNATGGASGNRVRIVVDPTSDRLSGEPGAPIAYVCKVESGTGSRPDTLTYEGAGRCRVTLEQSGTVDGYEMGTLGPFDIVLEATDATVTLDVPTDAQVGVPMTVVARASAGVAPQSRGVPGSGDIVVRSGGALVHTGEEPWVDGVKRMVWTPTEAGQDMTVTVEFEADDQAAYHLAPLPGPRTVDIAVGEQQVALTTAAPEQAWVGDTWTPGAHLVRYGVAADAVPVTSTTSEVCSVLSDVVRFHQEGECTVTMLSPASTGTLTGVDWPEAKQERTFEVARHPIDIRITLPRATDIRASRPLTVKAQVAGRRHGGTTTERVPGSFVFTLDGHDVGANGLPTTPGNGEKYGIGIAGESSGTVRVVLTAAEAPVTPGGGYEHRIGARFIPDDPVFWEEDGDDDDALVLLNSQTITSRVLDDVPVGATWAPAPTSSASTLAVAMSVAPQAACSLSGPELVRFDAATEDGATCVVSYRQPGNLEYAEVSRNQQVDTVLRRPDVSLTPATGTVGANAALVATVRAPAWPPTPVNGITGVPATVPAGTVTFTITDGSGSVTRTAEVDVEHGTATAGYTPDTSAPRTVTAVFTPAATVSSTFGRSPAAGGTAPSTTLTVAKATTTTTVTTTPDAFVATVASPAGSEVRPTGTVTFTSVPMSGDQTPVVRTATIGPDGVARLTTGLPDRGESVRITAAYPGDGGHLLSEGSYERWVPTITGSTPLAAGAWSSGPVTATFSCQLRGASVETCPSPVTLTGEGAGQSALGEVTAPNGGYAAYRVGGINIDRTRPEVSVGGTTQGAWYAGEAPTATCRGTDRLSGIATCTVTRQRVEGRTWRDTALATDAAGNSASASVTYQVREEWVVKAPLVRSGFQVRPGTKQRVMVRTDDVQPQLMLQGANGRWQPKAVFLASSVDDGIVTWFVRIKVPDRVKVGGSYRIGYRLVGERKVTEIRLDVVRKPRTSRLPSRPRR